MEGIEKGFPKPDTNLESREQHLTNREKVEAWVDYLSQEKAELLGSIEELKRRIDDLVIMRDKLFLRPFPSGPSRDDEKLPSWASPGEVMNGTFADSLHARGEDIAKRILFLRNELAKIRNTAPNENYDFFYFEENGDIVVTHNEAEQENEALCKKLDALLETPNGEGEFRYGIKAETLTQEMPLALQTKNPNVSWKLLPFENAPHRWSTQILPHPTKDDKWVMCMEYFSENDEDLSHEVYIGFETYTDAMKYFGDIEASEVFMSDLSVKQKEFQAEAKKRGNGVRKLHEKWR